MRRVMLLTAWVVVAAAIVAAPLTAGSSLPEKIALPDGFRPEGIAIKGSTFYVGSIPTGAIYRGDLRTGQGSIFVPGVAGRAAIGVEYDDGRLFVAGGPTGSGFVYSARSGTLLASQVFTAPPTFVNDVVVARGGAYFTDSMRPQLYRLSIRRGSPSFETIPLSGDYVHQPGFNLNGIDATRDGRTLIVVQSGTGKLFTVDRRTGVTDEITLNEAVTNGDGLLLDGRTLYVVRNQQNRVAVVELNRSLTSGTVVTHITDPDFDIPTTIDDFGRRLYAVNARFTTPPTATTPYGLAQFQKVSGDRDDDDDDDEDEDDDD